MLEELIGSKNAPDLSFFLLSIHQNFNPLLLKWTHESCFKQWYSYRITTYIHKCSKGLIMYCEQAKIYLYRYTYKTDGIRPFDAFNCSVLLTYTVTLIRILFCYSFS